MGSKCGRHPLCCLVSEHAGPCRIAEPKTLEALREWESAGHLLRHREASPRLTSPLLSLEAILSIAEDQLNTERAAHEETRKGWARQVADQQMANEREIHELKARAEKAERERDEWKRVAEANMALAESNADAAGRTADERDEARARIAQLEEVLRLAKTELWSERTDAKEQADLSIDAALSTSPLPKEPT